MKTAIEAYTSVLDRWTSFELEYNLGGAHYKAGNIGPCILHYERARRMRPNDDDLNANLLLAQSAVTDRIEGMPEIGMASLWRELISQERLAGWTAASLFLWILGFILLGVRMFPNGHHPAPLAGSDLAHPPAAGFGARCVEQTDPPAHCLRRRRCGDGASGRGDERPVGRRCPLQAVRPARGHGGGTPAGRGGIGGEVQLLNGNSGWLEASAIGHLTPSSSQSPSLLTIVSVKCDPCQWIQGLTGLCSSHVVHRPFTPSSDPF